MLRAAFAVTLARPRQVEAVGVFILCVNLWRYSHLMWSSILTLWGHGQSKSLNLQPRHSHVMRKPTKRKGRSNNPMQKVMLIGNLGSDPEIRYSQQGTAIAQFSVATTERWTDKGGELQEHTEWFAVKTFGRRAEIVGENLHKGARVY